MRMRRTLGGILTALMLFASPSSAMCARCQFAKFELALNVVKSNTVGQHQTAAMVTEMTRGHCDHQHEAVSARAQSALVSDLNIIRSCQNQPCGPSDLDTRISPAGAAQLDPSLGSTVCAEVTAGLARISGGFRRVPAKTSTDLSASQPRYVSLRI